MGRDDEASFLSRWSRRKAEARRQGPIEPPPAVPEEADAGTPPAEPLELPDIASLDAASDYKPFLDARVPADLRRDALRRLWRVNPVINSLDGLDDPYVTGDFTDASTVVADLKTVYRVGRGMLDAVEEPAALVAAVDVPEEAEAPPAEPREEPGPA